MLERQLECDAAAVRRSDDRRALDRELVEQRSDVLDARERARRERRLAVAAQVAAYDAVARPDEGRDLRFPHAPVGDAGVQEHERASVAGVVAREANLSVVAQDHRAYDRSGFSTLRTCASPPTAP